MITHQDWPHRWFGYWKEKLPQLEICPSIYSFIGSHYEPEVMQKLLRYLNDCPGVMIAPATATCLFNDCHFPMKDYQGSWLTSTPLTDGTWLWPHDLSHYLQYHLVRLPEPMYNHIASSNFSVPNPAPIVDTYLLKSLDWPFLPIPVAIRLKRT